MPLILPQVTRFRPQVSYSPYRSLVIPNSGATANLYRVWKKRKTKRRQLEFHAEKSVSQNLSDVGWIPEVMMKMIDFYPIFS
jgi:hypothetical protein